MNSFDYLDACNSNARKMFVAGLKNDIKNVAKGIIKKKSVRKDIAFWPNALLAYALSYDKNSVSVIKKMVKKWGKRGFSIRERDDILMAYVLINKTSILDQKQCQKLRENVYRAINPFKNSAIPYRDNCKEKIYADLLGMAPQFLISDGIKTGNEKTIMWGVEQFREFSKHAIDGVTGLPYHAYNTKSLEKLGIIGWGRAVGWILLGLSESILALDDKHAEIKNELLGIFRGYIKTIEQYQREDGGFSWQLQAIDGPLDSSATGMILLSLQSMREYLGNKEKEMAAKMMKCLDGCCTKNGEVLQCSAECGGVGVYPQRYSSFAWSVAPYIICKNQEKNDGVCSNVEK